MKRFKNIIKIASYLNKKVYLQSNKKIVKFYNICYQINCIIIIHIIALRRCVNGMRVSHHINKPV